MTSFRKRGLKVDGAAINRTYHDPGRLERLVRQQVNGPSDTLNSEYGLEGSRHAHLYGTGEINTLFLPDH